VAQLYHQRGTKKIILTNDGQSGSWSNVEERNPHYYESTIAQLEALAVPKDAIEVLLEPVDSTYSEAIRVHRHAVERGLRRILVVTSGYHSRRALWTYNRVFHETGFSIGLEAAEIGWQTPSPTTWWLELRGWQTIPGEYIKLVYYRARY
jgi:uncharacterized SAM-binding protein YcdF (DUF218 family)